MVLLMPFMKNKLVFIAFVLSACVFIEASLYASKPASGNFNGPAEAEISGSVFSVEVVDSGKERARGLSGRESLSEGSGMLFIFEDSAIHGFWMKGMKFPIDIIWISDGKVVGWAENANPEPGVSDFDLIRYVPPRAIDMVLEVPAGTVAAKKIRIGDGVSLRNMVELHIIGE